MSPIAILNKKQIYKKTEEKKTAVAAAAAGISTAHRHYHGERDSSVVTAPDS